MPVIQPYRDVWPRIHDTAYVAANTTIIGDVEIGAGSSIWPGVVIRGDVNDVRIGSGSNVQDGTVIHVAKDLQGTYLGDQITVGHMVLLHACTLESGCFIGMRSCVMDGAVVESGAMVAAGALVTPGKRVRSGEVWAGTPAKPQRQVRPEEVDMFGVLVARYRDLGAEYLVAEQATDRQG